MPKVSVLMSVYNGAQYLPRAIDSILEQTFADFEFIIVDDGSTDDSWSILNSYSDPRIWLLQNESNLGLTKSLNKGISRARGEYIVRMDADDLAAADRIARQLADLERTGADVGFCRSLLLDDSTGQTRTWTEGAWPLVRWRGLFENRYGLHSAAMFRAKPIRNIGGYDEAFAKSQDYDLWARCLDHGLRFVYTPSVSLTYHFRAQGISRQGFLEQEEYARQISFRTMRHLLKNVTETELSGLRWLFLQREQRVDNECIQAGMKRCLEFVDAFLDSNPGIDSTLIWQDAAVSLMIRAQTEELPDRAMAISLSLQALWKSRSARTLARWLRLSLSSTLYN